MTISDFAIRRPVITVVSMVALVVFGLVSLLLLQTDEFPDVAVPHRRRLGALPGASPDNVEREIVEPMKSDRRHQRREEGHSNSLDGYGLLIIEFNFEQPGRCRRRTSATKINAIRNDLPVEMKEPVLTKVNPRTSRSSRSRCRRRRCRCRS
jgi:HAE1 family hydrophobic/amphiphilic exporter-1